MSYSDVFKRYYELSSTSVSTSLRDYSSHTPDVVSPNKREQARERQRLNRERDRASATMTVTPGGTSDANLGSHDMEIKGSRSAIAKRKGGGKGASLDDLPLGEARRKQRIREAARERQRKHRAAVKARKIIAVVDTGVTVEQTAVGFTINERGQYEAVLADSRDSNLQQREVPPPFQAHTSPGQMFASTLLYGLSYTPQIKQQLLRILRSTNEDLAAFEPLMAAGFDHWDSGRVMHYAAQGHHIPPPHMPTQSAPYDQPYPLANERIQPPLAVTFPVGPPHGRQDSPSPSEESHQANDDSDPPIEHEIAHTQDKAPGHIHS
ncbi:hypothetical protein JB92DRAFT_2984770 [Gautieria morchelliformis]|nr:hypothetical protein JB92DRAFT_2984770 [Gautieria morchelliformis]